MDWRLKLQKLTGREILLPKEAWVSFVHALLHFIQDFDHFVFMHDGLVVGKGRSSLKDILWTKEISSVYMSLKLSLET